MGCSVPAGYFCEMTAPTPYADVSAAKVRGNDGL